MTHSIASIFSIGTVPLQRLRSFNGLSRHETSPTSSKDTNRDLLGHLVKSYATPITRWSGVAPRSKQDGYLVFILLVVFFTDTDELPVLSDLDLDLFASRFLNVGLVHCFALFYFLGGFSDGAAAQVVLNGLLHR